ncbi:hypothetical protein GCM10025792_21320 [Pseudonocardia tropica]
MGVFVVDGRPPVCVEGLLTDDRAVGPRQADGMALEPQPGRVGESGAGEGAPGPWWGRRRPPDNENDADRREKVPAGQRRLRACDQAACLVSQKILSIWAM